MRTKRILQILLALIVIGGAAWWFKTKKKPRAPRETVERITVSNSSIEETVEATGEVAPLNRVEIKPPIQGRIDQILVDEGDKVKAGQTLAWMSSNDRAAILDAARAKGPEEYNRWADTYKPTPLIAPLSGVIILRNVVIGQTIDLSTVLFALSDKLIVLANVDEVDIGRVKEGMAARITLDSYPDEPIEGNVASILYEGKNVSNVITYGVKITPFNVPRFFRSQMTANVSLIVRREDDVVVIPRKAVQEGDGRKTVFVPGEDDNSVRKEVQTGIESGDQVQITSGLTAGDTILVMGRRYSPQKAASQSPLVMSGPRSGSGGSGQNAGGRRQSQSR